MSFWIITIAMAGMVSALLGWSLLRGARTEDESTSDYDLRVYRDQLSELDRDVARGVVPVDEAERTRTEISRRILAADTARGPVREAKQGPSVVALALLVGVVVAGSLALYSRMGAPGYGDLGLADRIARAEEMRKTRPSQQIAEQNLPPMPEPEGVTDEFQALMTRLRETVAARPDDARGHLLLAQNEARLGNFGAAAEAQEAIIRIKGDDATAQEFSALGEFLVLAAGGYVSPEAEAALREALARDPREGRAQYYTGLMMVQNGRPDVTFRIWDALLRQGPPDADWIDPIRAQIMAVADFAGVTYELPPVSGGRGPSAADVDAAGDLTADERMDMIAGMVEGLSHRLATEGGPAQDWARLITSLGVLDRRAEARTIYENAVDVFEGETTALDTIRQAGQRAGVAE